MERVLFVKAWISFFSFLSITLSWSRYFSSSLFPCYVSSLYAYFLMCHASPLFDIRHSLSLNFIFGYAFIVFSSIAHSCRFFSILLDFLLLLLFRWLFSQPSTFRIRQFRIEIYSSRKDSMADSKMGESERERAKRGP